MTAKQKLGPNQRKWLRALESGKFRQTTKGALKIVGGGHCCLGVACELFKTEAVILGRSDRKVLFNGESDIAPRFVIDALQLFGDCGDAKSEIGVKDPKSLTEMNDDGTNFKAIAASIKNDPAIYFRGPK